MFLYTCRISLGWKEYELIKNMMFENCTRAQALEKRKQLFFR